MKMLPSIFKRYSSTWLKKSGKILVSTDELAKSLISTTTNSLVVLDASWHMPAEGRDGRLEHREKRIPSSRYFNIDTISDPAGSPTNPLGLPHQIPTNEMFRQCTADLGVLTDDVPIVIYDTKGMFSAARVWYMFHAFGHRSVYLLDGGLPLWEAEDRELSGKYDDHDQVLDHRVWLQETATTDSGSGSDSDSDSDSDTVSSNSPTVDLFGDGIRELDHRVSVELDDSMVRDYDQILDHVRKRNAIIMDARSSERFNGDVPEPRIGLRSGSIPTSISLPFTTMLNTYTLNNIEVTQFKTKKEIRSIIVDSTRKKSDDNDNDNDDDNDNETGTTATFGKAGEGFSAGGLKSARTPIVTTCGSGVSACVLAAGLRIAGFDHTLALYDGSWSEWGSIDIPDDIS